MAQQHTMQTIGNRGGTISSNATLFPVGSHTPSVSTAALLDHQIAANNDSGENPLAGSFNLLCTCCSF
jgi:hypothetical protein